MTAMWDGLRTIVKIGMVLWLTGALAQAADGRTNAPSGGGRLTFSPPGGVYTNSVTVRLTLSQSTATVRYTLDGSEPDSSSVIYSDPIVLTNTSRLKARLFDSRSARNATFSQTYLLIDPELANFTSNLPLVLIDSFGQSVPHERSVRVAARFIDVHEGRSRLNGPANFWGQGDLNVRGNTSLRYPKHSYHLDTIDDANRSLKVPLLGFPEESDWILYAPYPDKTLMRDVLAYELSNAIGRYASRTKFLEVFVNESGGPLSKRHYLGVYVLAEKIKRGKARVAVTKLGPQDNAEPNITGGYIIKKDHTDRIEPQNGLLNLIGGSGQETYFRTRQGNLFFYVEPKAREITGPQKTWLRQYLNSFEQVLYGEGFRDPKTGYAAFIDTDSFIDHHLLVELTKNIDGFRFSTFYYKDRGGKLTLGPLWDWNLSFGNANGKQGWIPEGWYWPQLDDQQYSWFRRLFQDPDFTQKYVDRWGVLSTNEFSVTNLHARIDYWAARLEEAQKRNFQRWRILGRNINPNSFVGDSFREEIDWMKDWIDKRISWIHEQFVPSPTFSLPAGPVPRGRQLDLLAPVGTIYYTLDGTDPRAPGGRLSPSARPFKAPILLNSTATVFCRSQQDHRWSYPAVARFVVGKTATGSTNAQR